MINNIFFINNFLKICKNQKLEANTIEHKGIVKYIGEDKIVVQIISQAMCASCQVKGHCSVADTKEKDVDVFVSKLDNYKIGDSVDVVIAQNLGLKAVMIAYFLPFIVLVISLIIFLQTLKDELISGLLALGTLLPYYSLIWIFRNKIKKEFKFKIK